MSDMDGVEFPREVAPDAVPGDVFFARGRRWEVVAIGAHGGAIAVPATKDAESAGSILNMAVQVRDTEAWLLRRFGIGR